jgi:hypothetical protein
VDAIALRVKKIEIVLHAAERRAEFQLHVRAGVLAAGVTVAASAAVGGLAGQVPPPAAAAGLLGGAALVVAQLRGIRQLLRARDAFVEVAVESIDNLISRGGEPHVDAEPEQEGA